VWCGGRQWRTIQYLGGRRGALHCVLMFDSLDPFCFMVDSTFDFSLVKSIDDGVFALRDMD